MNAELTELVFILDRSGSMGGLESDTIGGFNGMIAKQKEQEKKVNVTTILFDDEIDSIRTFDVFSQKSIEKINKFSITPSREFIYPENVEEAVDKIKKDTDKNTNEDVFLNIDNINSKTYFQGIENYIDYLYPEENKSIFTYLQENAIVFFNDISRTKERCENYLNEFKENYKLNLERGLAIKNQGKLLYTYNDLDFLSEGRKLVLNTLLPKPINDFNVKSIINFDSREVPTFNAKVDVLAEELNRSITDTK